MTRVVNINKERCDVYVGRPSPFGNPYVIGKDGTREEVIAAYSVYFHKRLDFDPEWKAKVGALKGRVLGCHCKPSACHGDVIAEWVDQES